MRTTTLLALILPFSPIAYSQDLAGRVEKAADVLDTPLPAQSDIAAGSKFEGHDGKTKTDGGASQDTIFNGRHVPPITNLTTATIKDELSKGNWFVEFFSPYCHHCKKFAPTWQTMYEFYYTSDPLPQAAVGSQSDLNSFTDFYNFRFAKVDCVANGDACSQYDVTQYPAIKVFKNGVTVDTKFGARDVGDLSKWIEEVLEVIKPGTRPVGGPKLPKVGDRSVDDPSLPPAAALVPIAPGLKDALAEAKETAPSTKLTPLRADTPNVRGTSVSLTAESFQKLVTTTQNPWFIKFHVPWCHHCLEIAPKWKEMAHQKQGQLNVGEVNCEVERRLCKDVKVNGYPTMLFFRGGERIEYHGMRGLGDLIDFGTKAVAIADGIRDVNATEFEELEKTEDVLFLYHYDAATTSEDFAALDRLLMSMIGHAKLYKTSDQALAKRFKISTWPRYIVSRDGKSSYYDGLAPSDMRDFRRVLDWMKSVWLPIVPELTAANARDIMDNKLVVLGILNRDRTEDFATAKREIKNAALEWLDKQEVAFHLELQELRDAKQLRIEEAEDRDDQRGLRAAKSIRINMGDIERRAVTFAWIDSVFWERWIKTTYGISVKDGDRVVINDEANQKYWDVTENGVPISPSRTSIIGTLTRIVANPPKIKPKRRHTLMGHLWWTVKRGFVKHPLLNAGVVLVIVVSVALWARSRFGSRLGRVRLGEKGSSMDGLLNGNIQSSGKVD